MKLVNALVMTGVVMGAVVAAPKAAHAGPGDDCLEVGWKDKAGNFTYYQAWVDAYEEHGRVHIKYDYHHGELELKVYEKEKADGADVIVMRGKWFEGKEATRTGKVRLEMEKGHHHARGWYTYGEGEDAPHYDFVMRDCKK